MSASAGLRAGAAGRRTLMGVARCAIERCLAGEEREAPAVVGPGLSCAEVSPRFWRIVMR